MMYSENQNDGDFSPTLKFQSYKFRAGKAKKSFLHFVDEVMSGKLNIAIIVVSTARIGAQREHRIYWPLCYIAFIFGSDWIRFCCEKFSFVHF